MTPQELKARTKRFALEVLRISDAIPKTTSGRAIASQLIRSATSVGANYRATCLARSRAEFASKIGIVLEEADESAYWLELLQELGLICETKVAPHLQEARELTCIMAASRKQALQNGTTETPKGRRLP